MKAIYSSAAMSGFVTLFSLTMGWWIMFTVFLLVTLLLGCLIGWLKTTEPISPKLADANKGGREIWIERCVFGFINDHLSRGHDSVRVQDIWWAFSSDQRPKDVYKPQYIAAIIAAYNKKGWSVELVDDKGALKFTPSDEPTAP